MRVRRVLLVAASVSLLAVPVISARAENPPCAWPMYGHDAQHSFQADCSTVSAANAPSLVPKWVFHAADSVTASPAVVGGAVYVGDWAGNFYALDAATGIQKWVFQIGADARQTAFGRIVSSAAIHRFEGTDVILFGGGSTLYALGTDGALLAKIDVDPDPAAHIASGRTVEIESSPAVVDDLAGAGSGPRIFVGMDVHNDAGVARTGVLSLRLVETGNGSWQFEPLWKFDPETESVVSIRDTDLSNAHGCGGVWSSPAVDVVNKVVYFGTSSCESDQIAKGAKSEGVFAVDAMTGAERWSYRPPIDASYGDKDADFGASPNVYDANGRHLVGNGRKDARYFVFDRLAGTLLASPTVGQPGVQPGSADFAVGGFIGTPAVEHDPAGQAERIVGATAIPIPIDSDPSGQNYSLAGDPTKTTWAVRALDPTDGHVLWTYQLDGPSYGATSIVNGVALVPDTFGSNLLALDSATGRPLAVLPMPAPPSSTPVAVGDTVYVGGGTRTTDAEYKSFKNSGMPDPSSAIGNSPLSPLSGVFAFRVLVP